MPPRNLLALPGFLQTFLENRSRRERAMLMLAVPLLAATLLFTEVYEPIVVRIHTLESQLPRLRAEARQIVAQSAEIERLRSQPNRQEPGVLDIAQRVTAAAQRWQLTEALDLTSLDKQQVEVKLTAVPAGDWLAWQGELARYGIHVRKAEIRLEAKPGQVSVEALLSSIPL